LVLINIAFKLPPVCSSAGTSDWYPALNMWLEKKRKLLNNLVKGPQGRLERNKLRGAQNVLERGSLIYVMSFWVESAGTWRILIFVWSQSSHSYEQKLQANWLSSPWELLRSKNKTSKRKPSWIRTGSS